MRFSSEITETPVLPGGNRDIKTVSDENSLHWNEEPEWKRKTKM
jgi:hypothetical protein